MQTDPAMDLVPRELPFEITFFEILTRASPETLARCRLVSKTWNKATYAEHFAQLFLQRAKVVSGYYAQTLNRFQYSTTFVMENNIGGNLECYSNKLSLSFLPGRNIEIVATTKQGLLLCLNHDAKRPRLPQYIVCKPTTQQWQQIRNPKTRYFTEKIMMVVLGSNPIRYKIVRFSEPECVCVRYKSKLYTTHRCEIFDSKIWAWKCLSENIKLPYYESLDLKSMISISGNFLYALTYNHKSLFVFDIEKESSEIFSIPQPLCNEFGYCKNKLVEYEGKLGMLCMVTKECMELWVMNDKINGQTTWSMRKKEDFGNLLEKERHASLVEFCNNDLALMNGFYKAIFYNFQNSTLNEVKLKNHVSCLYPDKFFRVEYSNWEPIELVKPQKISSSRSRSKLKLSRTTTCSHEDIQLGWFTRYLAEWTPPPEYIFIFFLVVATLFCYILDW